jgi:hypothetical protein
MISQSVRLMLLLGFLIFAVCTPGPTSARGSTATLHQQTVLGGPGAAC